MVLLVDSAYATCAREREIAAFTSCTTLMRSDPREKLPRSKEKFRLENDSGKRDGGSTTSPFSVAAGASTTIVVVVQVTTSSL